MNACRRRYASRRRRAAKARHRMMTKVMTMYVVTQVGTPTQPFVLTAVPSTKERKIAWWAKEAREGWT